jgi:hypothetical protein
VNLNGKCFVHVRLTDAIEVAARKNDQGGRIGKRHLPVSA